MEFLTLRITFSLPEHFDTSEGCSHKSFLGCWKDESDYRGLIDIPLLNITECQFEL